MGGGCRLPGGGEVHLIEVPDWVPPKGQHWAFKVDDIDATVTELRDGRREGQRTPCRCLARLPVRRSSSTRPAT